MNCFFKNKFSTLTYIDIQHANKVQQFMQIGKLVMTKLHYYVVRRAILILLIFGAIYGIINYVPYFNITQSIKVGILHSQSGPMAFNEKPVIDAALMAIAEINNKGGVLGIPLEPVIADGKSDATIFAHEAERLITQENVAVIFGCWTSSSRKSVKPVVEKYSNLLFYPVQYEGLEEPGNIVYGGATPNQQVIPAVLWCINTIGKNIFFVGSDYIFPRVTHEILKECIPHLGATIVGQEYVTLGTQEVAHVLQKIDAAKPDVIISTINGLTNMAFFKGLNAMAQKSGTFIPTMSFSMTEDEFSFIDTQDIVGHYTSWSYFQSINSDRNYEFVKKMHLIYGEKQLINDPMETAYNNVHVWKALVEEIGTTQAPKVLETLQKKYMSLQTPEGFIGSDKNSLNFYRASRIAQINKEGKNDIIWTSLNVIKPEPHPNETLLFHYIQHKKSTQEWAQYINNLYAHWGNKWTAQ